MGFVQIIEIKTSRIEDLEVLHEQYLADTEGTRTVLSERICQDRDNPGTYLIIVEFPSHEVAMANNDLPATNRIAEGIASLADEPPMFRNLDVVRFD
jgi:quinol monooxygenase YgiN